jgi:HK97 family phage major capsid protein
MNIKTLIEKRAGLWASMKEMQSAVESDGWTAEIRESWDRAEADLATLDADIDRAERSQSLDARFDEIDARTIVPAGEVDTRDHYADAFARFIRSGLGGLDTEERSLLQANYRAQGVSSGSIGGYTVPEGFWAKVTESLKYYGGIVGNVEQISTTSGNDLPWPTNDDTANVGAILVEGSAISGQDMAFGTKQLGSYMYTSKLVLASYQFLQDTGIDAEGFIARKLGERLGRIYNNHATIGTGTAQPQGLITGISAGATAAATATATYNDLLNLQHSVDVAYRGNAVFMMHDLVLKEIRKLVDDNKRPLWEPSLQSGVPSSLLGHPVVVNNDMDSTVATTKKTVVFGDLRAAYVWRTVAGGQLVRLDERYADYLQVGFFGFGRADGVVQDAGAAKFLVQP